MEEEVIFSIEIPKAPQAITTIENLTRANKALREERKKLDLDTEQGRRRVEEINKAINENTQVIKDNSSALEKQRLNVGNYTESIKDAAGQLGGIAPGISGFISGIQGMTKASLAFIATPIGAIIGAIGLALSALTAYFKGSEDGQNKLNKIMQVGSAIMGKVMDVVRDLGEAIFTAFTNPKQALTDFVDLIKNNIQNRIEGLLELFPKLGQTIELVFKGKFDEAGQVAFDAIAKVTTGVEDATSKVIGLFNEVQKTVDLALSQGLKVANLQELLRQKEREYEIESAKTFLRVSELKLKAEQTVGEERRKAVSEAIALEQKLADKTVELAQIRFNLAKQEADIADNDIEANNALIKAEADLIRAKADRFNTVKELATKLFAVENEIRKQEDAARIAEEDELIAQLEREVQQVVEQDTLIKNYLRESEDQFRKEQKEKEQEALDKSTKAVQKAAEEQIRIEQLKNQALAGFVDTFFQKQSAARFALSAIFKKDAISETFINTKAAAVAAYKSLAPIPIVGPVLGIAAAAAATAYGLNTVAQITGINFIPGFARGGVLRSTQGTPIQRSNGDDRLITAKVGETILTREQTARIGTRRLAAAGVPGFATGGQVNENAPLSFASISRQTDSVAFQREIFNAISQIRPVVTVEDINLGQERVEIVESRAQVI